MADISTITHKPRTVDIKNPVNGEPIGLRVTLLSEYDDRVKAVARKHLDERIEGKKIDASGIEANRVEYITASVAGWEWAEDASFEGTKPEFNPAIFKRVIGQLPWIREQVDAEIGKTVEFLRPADE